MNDADGSPDLPVDHRGINWPEDGDNPFDGSVSWSGLVYWAHGELSRLFHADRMPTDTELLRAIPMGYTTLTLMERVALVVNGRQQRIWQHDARYAKTPLQPYQLVLPPTATSGYLKFGTTWPFKWAVRDAEALSARTGGAVLVCQVLSNQNWH
ncbi:hypothetical protein V6U90_21640 [Micromonospora sp. CPCC 206060]|uniref:hypothetical protein n=1 Tax=Micromonospora sp. CPCC 206060 TaxID=3122406 RepID=UPI002FF0113A